MRYDGPARGVPSSPRHAVYSVSKAKRIHPFFIVLYGRQAKWISREGARHRRVVAVLRVLGMALALSSWIDHRLGIAQSGIRRQIGRHESHFSQDGADNRQPSSLYVAEGIRYQGARYAHENNKPGK